MQEGLEILSSDHLITHIVQLFIIRVYLRIKNLIEMCTTTGLLSQTALSDSLQTLCYM